MNPSVLSNIEEVGAWLHNLQVWQCVKDLEKKQQSPVIYLSLPDKVRSLCRAIRVANLSEDCEQKKVNEKPDTV